MELKPCAGAQCDQAKMPTLGTDIVTIIVGPDDNTREFVLYADLVKQHSGLFQTELEQNSSEQASSLRWPDLSADDFELFILFAYTGHIFTMEDKVLDVGEWKHLAKLWALGHTLRSTTFKDSVIDALMQRRIQITSYAGFLHEVMAQDLKEPSGVRRLLVDIAVTRWSTKFLQQPWHQDVPLNFYHDIYVTLDNLGRSDNPLTEAKINDQCRRKTNCLYHDHGKDEMCYRTVCSSLSDNIRRKKSETPKLESIKTEVHVGLEGADKFILPKALAIRHSQLFAKALDPNGHWKEAQENVVPLPEVEPEIFTIFAGFLSTGRIHLCHIKQATSPEAKGSHDNNDWEDVIAQAWLLGDQLLSSSFKNAVVDKLTDMVSKENKIPKTMFSA